MHTLAARTTWQPLQFYRFFFIQQNIVVHLLDSSKLLHATHDTSIFLHDMRIKTLQQQVTPTHKQQVHLQHCTFKTIRTTTTKNNHVTWHAYYCCCCCCCSQHWQQHTQPTGSKLQQMLMLMSNGRTFRCAAIIVTDISRRWLTRQVMDFVVLQVQVCMLISSCLKFPCSTAKHTTTCHCGSNSNEYKMQRIQRNAGEVVEAQNGRWRRH